jgi:drug/metabolite transporter (DMT)-like permease
VNAIGVPELGALCALGSAMMWALTGLLVRSLAPVLGSVKVNTVRSGLSGLLLLGWVVVAGKGADLASVSVTSLAFLTLSIVAAIGVGDTVFFESARLLGLARAMTVSMTYPLLAALMAAVLFGEAVTPRLAVGSLLTLGGLVLIVGWGTETDDEGRRWLGIGAASLASVAWAASVVLMKPPLTEVEPVTAQAIRLPLAAALLAVTPWARGTTAAVRNGGRPVLVRVAVLSVLTALSSVMFVAGLKYAGVTVASVLSSTAPMFAIPLGFFFLDERLTLRMAAGTAVTVVGVIVMQL